VREPVPFRAFSIGTRMRQSLIAGNWKMHGSREFVADYAVRLRQAGLPDGAELLLLPPMPYLTVLREVLGALPVALGVQNVHAQPAGAHTGELSAEMAFDLGAQWTLAGHSERRLNCGEDDRDAAAKVAAALRAGLTPILCVGETLAEREAGSARAVVTRQLDAVVAERGAALLQRMVLAYEPVWAIGTGRTATAEQAGEMHGYLRERAAEIAGAEVADRLRILYGGSVKPENAAALLAHPHIDGALVGGASLQAEDFAAIARAAV
jgi:triosephosphate isomerase (TIM)